MADRTWTNDLAKLFRPSLAQPSNESAQAAINAVFGTTELLENILRFVPRSDIYRNAVYVSYRWARTIAGSVTLQQYLFLSPETTEQESFMIIKELMSDGIIREYGVPLRLEEDFRTSPTALLLNPLVFALDEVVGAAQVHACKAIPGHQTHHGHLQPLPAGPGDVPHTASSLRGHHALAPRGKYESQGQREDLRIDQSLRRKRREAWRFGRQGSCA